MNRLRHILGMCVAFLSINVNPLAARLPTSVVLKCTWVEHYNEHVDGRLKKHFLRNGTYYFDISYIDNTVRQLNGPDLKVEIQEGHFRLQTNPFFNIDRYDGSFFGHTEIINGAWFQYEGRCEEIDEMPPAPQRRF